MDDISMNGLAKKWTAFLYIAFTATAASFFSQFTVADERLAPLRLIRAIPIDGQPTEPSGLSYCQGELLMVSDADQDKIFRLEPESVSVTAIEYLRLENIPVQPVPLHEEWGYDWEAIACDENENLYLMSEELGNILVIKNFKASHWLNTPIYNLGKPLGFFALGNAGAEGIARFGEAQIIVAAERSEAGLLEIDIKTDKVVQHHTLGPTSEGAFPEDVSDLHIEGNKIYSLQRFHSKICRRNLNAEQLTAEICWGFKQVEKADEYLYQESFYGKAEGLTRIGNKIFVVLDNNGQYRKNNQEDKRPLLFVFEKPLDW